MTDRPEPKSELTAEADMAAHVATLRGEMERLALMIRDLVIGQPPIQLLGYVRAQLQMANMTNWDEEHGPDREVLKSFQLALEYLHAIWACHASLPDESTPFDEAAAAAFLKAVDDLGGVVMAYCLHSESAFEFQAKSAWALIRGHRYQVLEGEFFRYVLSPHADALCQAYGMGPDDIAGGIQAISDAFRSGFSSAFETLLAAMDRTRDEAEAKGVDVGAVLEDAKLSDPEFIGSLKGGIEDMFFGGVCNLTRHSKLSAPLLDDLAFEPGGDDRFFADGNFRGTPMRALPARSRPAVKLGDAVYATDGQFVRDSAYRAIQWGLWRRLPYRDEWIKRQARVVEQAFPAVFARQLAGSRIYESVYYRDMATGEWTEADLVAIFQDVLIIVEAKAGVMPMQSPATHLSAHERVIAGLVTAAYKQCRRFLEYLASAPEVSLYNLIDGVHAEVAKVRHADFRRIYPIGLTVEALTPFSAMAKEYPEVEPILGQHHFMSMSVDDLFVLTRFLPTSGELMHYLDVRQAAAGVPGAHLFDETDHLGAYILKNRFDQDLREQMQRADLVAWTDFSDVVDRHFEGADWESTPPPSQPYPPRLHALLAALDRFRPPGWLAVDMLLRDLGEGRDDIEGIVSELLPSLREVPRRRFQIGVAEPIQVWLCRERAAPDAAEIRKQGEIACLVVGAPRIPVVVTTLNHSEAITGLQLIWVKAPSILQIDHPVLKAEADRERMRSFDPSGGQGR